MRVQLQVLDDRGPQPAHRVRDPRRDEARRDLGVAKDPAHLVRALQHDDLATGLRQVGRRHEGVVPAADDDDVGPAALGRHQAALRPHRVVDEDPHPGLAGQQRRELGVAGRERGGGDRAIRLPGVAELTGAVRRRHARLIVDLVGRDPGLPLMGEAGREALAHALQLVGRHELLDHDEAVTPKLLDLLGSGAHTELLPRPEATGLLGLDHDRRAQPQAVLEHPARAPR